MALGDLDLLGGIGHTGHRVSGSGRLACRPERGEVPRRVELGVPVSCGDRVGDTADDGIPVGELRGELGPRKNGRSGAVSGRAAVEESEWLGDLGRPRVHLGRDLFLEMRLGVERSVVVVLHRHRPERLLVRPVLLEVTRGKEGEHAGRSSTLGQHRMPAVDRLRDQRAARGHLAHFFGSHREHQVVLTRRHGQRGIAHRLDARGAVRGHAGDGDREEVERVGDESARVALEAVEHGLVAAEPASLELARFDLPVGHGQVDGLEDHVGEALVEVLPELDGPGTDDGDLAAESAHELLL